MNTFLWFWLGTIVQTVLLIAACWKAGVFKKLMYFDEMRRSAEILRIELGKTAQSLRDRGMEASAAEMDKSVEEFRATMSAGSCIRKPVATGTMHIYTQLFWHDDAYIAGTPDSLVALRDAIERALLDGSGKMSCFAADGEGYSVHILPVTENQADTLALAYTDDLAREHRENVLWPWVLLRKNSVRTQTT